MIQGCAKAVDIRTGIGLTHTAELLGRSVADGAKAHGIGQILLLELTGSTEVDQRHVAIGLKHDVGGLHITVDNGRSPGVQVAQHVGQLLCPVDNVLLRLGAVFFQCLIQGVALDIVHDDDKGIITVDNVDDTGQIRVLQLLQNVRFRHQTLLNDLEVLNAVFTDFLNRPVLICFFIDSQIDDTHAALSDFTQNSVFSVDQRSNLQHSLLSSTLKCSDHGHGNIIPLLTLLVQLDQFQRIALHSGIVKQYAGLQLGKDLLSRDLMTEAVRAEHIHCVLRHITEEHIGIYVLRSTDTLQQNIPAGIYQRFLRSHMTQCDLSCHEGLVRGNLAQAAGNFIGTGVTHIQNIVAVLGQQRSNHRSAQTDALTGAVSLDQLILLLNDLLPLGTDSHILQRCVAQLGQFLINPAAEGIDDSSAGNLAHGKTAHTVAQNAEGHFPLRGVQNHDREAILIGVLGNTDIGIRRNNKIHNLSILFRQLALT